MPELLNRPLVQLALDIATKAHEGQTRWEGEPYIVHPIRVAQQFDHEKLQAIALLHDVIEDSKWDFQTTVEDITNAGIPSDIVNTLKILTHGEESYADYIENIGCSKDERAIMVKMADLRDNLKSLAGDKHRQRRDKYELAYAFLNYVHIKEFGLHA